MKFLIKATLTILLSLITLAVYALPNNKAIIISPQDTLFSITLSANTTTGYQWFAKYYNHNLFTLLSYHYIPSKTNLMGAGGTAVFVFEIKRAFHRAPQISNIGFVYGKPWSMNSMKTTDEVTVVSENYNKSSTAHISIQKASISGTHLPNATPQPSYQEILQHNAIKTTPIKTESVTDKIPAYYRSKDKTDRQASYYKPVDNSDLEKALTPASEKGSQVTVTPAPQKLIPPMTSPEHSPPKAQPTIQQSTPIKTEASPAKTATETKIVKPVQPTQPPQTENDWIKLPEKAKPATPAAKPAILSSVKKPQLKTSTTKSTASQKSKKWLSLPDVPKPAIKK